MLPPGAVVKRSCCKRGFMPSAGARITHGLELLQQPIVTAEFMVVDTETNGLGGDACEVTEVGAVLVGGGELHDRWDSLVRTNMPLRRGIQRFTGITQAMVEDAPAAEEVLPLLARRLEGRVMVAHNAPFDRRVLRQAFVRANLEWPDPPLICTAAVARTLLPLQRERKLGALADALGIDVTLAHRALADAETCARVLCALFPRLCANAITIADALALLKPRRPSRRRPRGNATTRGRWGEEGRRVRIYRSSTSGSCRVTPACTCSVMRQARPCTWGSRCRFAAAPAHILLPRLRMRNGLAHASVVDYRSTCSELGALVLENQLIKQLRPAGNVRLARVDDRLVYIRCRLDIPFPILEVASAPAAGHAVSIGPLRGRRLAAELVEQLDSLFGLRHCGRRMPRREHPSAYGQMGRCLSPCLGDLDPNLYRRRLDAALAAFLSPQAGSGQRLLDHVYAQMREAAARQLYERASWLRRRARRLQTVLDRLDGVLEATHVRPRLILAAHPTQPRFDAFWMVGGRLVDWGPLPEGAELTARTKAALRPRSPQWRAGRARPAAGDR